MGASKAGGKVLLPTNGKPCTWRSQNYWHGNALNGVGPQCLCVSQLSRICLNKNHWRFKRALLLCSNSSFIFHIAKQMWKDIAAKRLGQGPISLLNCALSHIALISQKRKGNLTNLFIRCRIYMKRFANLPHARKI